MPGYTSELYNYISSIDKTFKNDVSFDQFKSKMADRNYSKTMYDWIGQNDNTFQSDVPFDLFREKLGYKKKSSTGLPSQPQGKGTTSATVKTTTQKPSVSSGGKKVDIFTGLPGKEDNQYRVINNQWQRKEPNKDWSTVRDANAIIYLNKYYKKNITPNEGFEGISSKLIDNEEEAVTTYLKNNYGNLGFNFEESGAGDRVTVLTEDGTNSETFYLDNWTDNEDASEAIRMKAWLKENIKTSDRERYNKIQEQMAQIKDAGPKQKTDFTKDAFANKSAGLPADLSLDIKQQLKVKELEKQAMEYNRSRMNTLVKDINEAKKTSGKYDDEFTRARVAAVYGNKDEIAKQNSYISNNLEDIARANKYVSNKLYQYEQEQTKLNEEIDANGGILSPEMEEKQRSLEGMAEMIKAQSEDLKSSINTSKKDQNKINEMAGEYMLFKESKGTVGGGIVNNFLKGATNLARFSGLSRQGQEELIKLIGSDYTENEFTTSAERSDIEKVLFSLSNSIGAAVGGGGVATNLSFFAQSYYELKDQMDDDPNFDSVPELEKTLLASTYGIAIGALEKFGLDVIASKTPLGKSMSGTVNKILASTIKGLPKGAGAEVLEEAINKNIKTLIAKGAINVVGGSIVEGSTEFTQELVGGGIKELYNTMKEKEMFKSPESLLSQAYESAWLGALGGAVMQTPVQAVNAIATGLSNKNTTMAEILEKAVTDSELRSMMTTSIKSKIVAGEINSEEGKKQLEAVNQAAGTFQKMPDNLTQEDKSTSFDLMIERSKIEKEIEGKDENLVAAQKARIADINNQLKTISENATKKSTEQQQKGAAEGGVIQREGTSERQPEVGQGEGTVGQATQQGTDLGNRPVEGRGEAQVTARQAINRPAMLTAFGGTTFDSPLQGDTYVEGQQVIFEDRSTGRVYELGNVDEVMDSTIPGLQLQEETISVTQEGKVSIDGNNWNIQSELPTQGVEYNPDGTVMRVSLKDDNGNTQMFDGQQAVDIAYQIELQKMQTPEQQQFINDLLEQNEEFQAATESIKPTEVEAVIEEETAPDTVQAEPTTEPTAEPTAPQSEVEALGKLLEGTDVEIDQQIDEVNVPADKNRVLKSVAKAAKSISKILPNVKFIVHETDDSYRKATNEEGRSQSSRGTYMPATQAGPATIHINLTNANNRTVAHEVFHAILLDRVSSDKQAAAVTRRMISAISKNLANDSDLKKYLDNFAANYDQNIQNEEKLAELVGVLAENYMNQPPTIKDIIKRWLNKIAQFIGMKPITSETEVMELLNTIARRVTTGKKIRERKVAKIIGEKDQPSIASMNKRFQADFKDTKTGVEFVFDKNSDKFKKLEDDGYITRDKSIKDFNGSIMFLHQPDGAFSGMIYKNGELLVEGKGGVFYPIKFHEDGYFWASTDSAATKMAKDLNKVYEENGGKIFMALTTAPEEKLLSSTTAANAVMEIFMSKAFDRGFSISRDDVKKSLLDAASYSEIKKTLVTDADGNPILDLKGQKQYKNKRVGLSLNLKKGGTIDDIKSDIATKLNPSESSFADRKLFAQRLISNIANIVKQNPKATEQFNLFFKESIKNEQFKGTREKGKDYLKISSANLKQAISNMLTEPMLKGNKNAGEVYAILEIGSKVKPVESDKHESYPKAIQVDGDSKTTLHILTDRVLWSGIFEDFKTGKIVTSKREKKIYPTSGVSVRGLRLNTSNIEGGVTQRKQLSAPNGKPSNLNEKQWNQVRTPEFKKWFGDWENNPKNASKVIDENGEPLVMYHGSLGEFDEFESRFLGSRTRAKSAEMGFFFSDDKKVADSYVYYGQLQNPNIDDLKPIIYGMTREQLGDFQSTVLNQFDDSDSYSDEDLEYFKNDIFRAVEYDSEQNILDSFKYIEKAEKFLKSKNINKEFSAYPKGYIYESFLNIRNPKQQNLNGDVFDSTYTLGISNNNDGVILDNAIDSVSLEEKDGGIESKIVIALKPTQIKSATENVGTFSTEEKSIRKQLPDLLDRKQQQSASSIVSVARKNGFSEAAIKQYLESKGFSANEITSAMAINDTIDIDEIFERSKKALREKKSQNTFMKALKFVWDKFADRQLKIKQLINGIKTAPSAKAFDLLVNRAGAKGFANDRYKEAEDKIYSRKTRLGIKRTMSESEIDTLDKMIYLRRIIAINENRAERGMEAYRGIEGFSEAEAKRDLEQMKEDLGVEKYNDMMKRADEYFKVFAQSLKNLYESGRLTEEVYNNLKDIEYSPIATIKYIIGDDLSLDEIDRQAEIYGITRKDIATLTDKNENEIIMDSRWLLMMNLMSIEARAWENRMLNSFVDAIESASEDQKKALSEFVVIPKSDQKVPAGFVTVNYFKDGKAKKMFVKADYAVQLLDIKTRKSGLEAIGKLSGTQILRFFATGGNPLFIVGNTAVDFANIAFFSNTYSNIKFIGAPRLAYDFLKNFLRKIISTKKYNAVKKEFIEHGGAMDFMSSDGLRVLKNLRPGYKVVSAAQSVLVKYANAMSYLGETSELAFRIAVYEKTKENLIKDYKKENEGKEPKGEDLDNIMFRAARDARQTVDFSQGGSWAKSIDIVMPYFNASIQGFRRPLEYAKSNPIAFSFSILQASSMAAGMAYMSLASLMSSFGDDEDDDEKKSKIIDALNSISEYEKSNYHIIFTGKKNKEGEYEYIRIKKLPVLSMATTLAEQLVYKTVLKNDKRPYAFDEKSMYMAIEKSIPIAPSELMSRNPLISGILSYHFNEDTFTGEEIFRQPRDKKIDPTAEGLYDDKVDGLYKEIAPALGLSPIRTKAFVEKIITSENTNPTVGIFNAAMNGIFDKNTGLGEEFSTAMERVAESAGKKLIRYTNKDIIMYNEMDKAEAEEMRIETDIYKKEQKMYSEIKSIYKDGGKMSVDQLIDKVKKNFHKEDWENYAEKYYTYIQNMNVDRSVLDILYEKTPDVQALKLFNRYGSTLDDEEIKEISSTMQTANKKISDRAFLIYKKKYQRGN